MLLTMANISANSASPGGICWVYKYHLHSQRFGLVCHKVLKLPPRPAVEARAEALASLYVFADIGQILHCDNGTVIGYRLGDNGPADFVVHMANMTAFTPGDFPQKLLRAFGAFALKPFTKMQGFVALMTELAAAKKLPGGSGGEIVLAHINAKHCIASAWRGVWQIKDKIEKPFATLAHKLGFHRNACGQISLLEGAQLHGHDNSSIKREKRNGIGTQTVCALVVMDGCIAPERDRGPFGVPEFFIIVCKSCDEAIAAIKTYLSKNIESWRK